MSRSLRPPAVQSRLFYGWWIVAITLVLAIYYSGVLFYSFTLFVTPVINDLDWNRSVISQDFFLSGIVGAILAPLVLGERADGRGGYRSGLLLFAAFSAAGAFLVLRLSRPRLLKT